MINISIFLQDLKKVVDLLKAEKNRKKLINEQFRLAKKSLDLIGYKSYFLKFKPFKSYKNFYFVFINIEDIFNNLSFFLQDGYFLGAVVAFSDFKNDKKLTEDILYCSDEFKFHLNLDEDTDNSSGYISFFKKGI